MNRKLVLIIAVAVMVLAVVTTFASNGTESNLLNPAPDEKYEGENLRQQQNYKVAHALRGTDSPEAVLRSYFSALKTAANLTERQMAVLGGTIGEGLQPYEEAYQCWSEDWRRKNSYQQFLASWQGTVKVELLKLILAGEQEEQARFFVETRHIEITNDNPRTGIFYYTGFFTVGKTQEGWRITGGNLEPQNLAWELGGHQPWRSDPVMVAQVEGLGVGMEAKIGKPVIQDNPNGTVTVKFLDESGREKSRVVLYKPRDGMWRVLEKINK